MSMNHQEKVRENLARLRRRQGAGFFSDPQAHITNDRYLILAPGGTGNEAAAQLQQEMNETFLPEEIDRKVRILAVDSDHTQLDARVEAGLLRSDQILKLPYSGVYESFANDPNLRDILPPNYTTFVRKQDGFDGKGAAARPLNGRILLTHGQAVQDLQKAVEDLAKELMNAKYLVGLTTLHVIVVCSFCGGTGSGLVVDLAYMVRHILDGLSLQFDMTCYGLTPSACRSNNTEKENFIATLKTVQHYMNIHYNGGSFTRSYAPGFTVNSTENIFTGLYLLDGMRTGILSQDPHGEAVHTAARAILNNMIL